MPLINEIMCRRIHMHSTHPLLSPILTLTLTHPLISVLMSLPWTITLPTLALIAQAVVLLE